ncbi:hypothetical protein Scep_003690 [Stephania cephalantha]|uniref:Cytochrome P450 n=1 Tax=Stephania cephalantha TaxID=152367 RepID=A0AAP0KR01_9MAGN
MEPYIVLLVQAIATAVLVTFLLYQLWCLRRKVRKITKSSSFNAKECYTAKDHVFATSKLLSSWLMIIRSWASLLLGHIERNPQDRDRGVVLGDVEAALLRSNVAKADEKMLFAMFQQFNYHLGNSEMYDALPFMAWLDFKGDAKAMKNTQKDLDYIMQTWLDEHRAKADQMRGDAINNTRDFLDVLVMMEKTGQFSSAIKDIDTTIKALALTQLVAGVDSMANTMVWVLALLLNNPEMLAKAQIELDTNVGKDRLVEESDIPNLKYLQALLKETLRMYPAGGHSWSRMRQWRTATWLDTSCRVEPAYSSMHGPYNVTQMSGPSRPIYAERFLTTNADMDVKGRSYEPLPFGSQDDRAPARDRPYK